MCSVPGQKICPVNTLKAAHFTVVAATYHQRGTVIIPVCLSISEHDYAIKFSNDFHQTLYDVRLLLLARGSSMKQMTAIVHFSHHIYHTVCFSVDICHMAPSYHILSICTICNTQVVPPVEYQ